MTRDPLQLRKLLGLFCAEHAVSVEGARVWSDPEDKLLVDAREQRLGAESVPEEARDLAEMHRRMAEVRKNAFFGMMHALRLSDEELRHTGSKTREAAVVGCYKHAQAELDKLTKAYLKKYPD